MKDLFMRIRFASVVSKLLAADFSAMFVGLLCLLGDSCSLGAAATAASLGEDAPTSLPRYLEWLPELESTKERALVSLARGPGHDIFFSDPLVEKLFSKRPAPGVRVVVCVTSIPARLPRIHPVLRSLLAQSLPPDVLYLVVPRRYHALRGEQPAFTDVAELPATITDLEEELGRSRFRVLRPEEDRVGPLMNLWAVGQGLLLAVLPEERNPATFLVTANDDHLQPVDFVRDLVLAALANPHRAVCYHGWISIVGDQQEDGKNKITDDLVPEGEGAQSLSYTMKPSEVAAVRQHIRRSGNNRTAGLVWMTQEGELASWKTPTYIQQEFAPAPAANVGGAAPNQLQWSPRGSSAYYATGPVGANYLGCIWQRGFFDAASFYRLPHFPQCRLVDDVWRAGLLALRAIRFLFLNRLPTGGFSSTSSSASSASSETTDIDIKDRKQQDQHYKPSAATKAIVDGSRAEQSIPLAEVRALTKEQGEFSSANMRAACHYQLVGIPTDSDEMISFRSRRRERVRDRRNLWRKRPRRVLIIKKTKNSTTTPARRSTGSSDGRSTGGSETDVVTAAWRSSPEGDGDGESAPARGEGAGAVEFIHEQDAFPFDESEQKRLGVPDGENYDRVYVVHADHVEDADGGTGKPRLRPRLPPWHSAALWEGEEDTEICVDSRLRDLASDAPGEGEHDLFAKRTGKGDTITFAAANVVCSTVAQMWEWREALLKNDGDAGNTTTSISARVWRVARLKNLLARVPGLFPAVMMHD